MTINDVTGIVVTHNTKELIRRALESIRKYYHRLRIIVIDGSDYNDPCRNYLMGIADELTEVIFCDENIGHGRGMDLGIEICTTPLALIFDSDIEMLRPPIEEMVAMIETETYGVGYFEKTAYDGYEYGAKKEHQGKPFMMMLHPFFHLLQISQYYKYHPYVHHGAPCYKAALDIHLKGMEKKVYKVFPNLGHTSGKGWCWDAIEPVWIRHDTAGTRKARRKNGKPEIEQGWEM